MRTRKMPTFICSKDEILCNYYLCIFIRFPVINIFGGTDMLILLPTTNIYCELKQWSPYNNVCVRTKLNTNSRPNNLTS